MSFSEAIASVRRAPVMAPPAKLPAVCVVVMVYPACLWFARLKERRAYWWLSYL